MKLDPKSLYVDASCIGNPGKMEYRVVDFQKKEIYRSPVYPLGTNNLGEFLAIVWALKYVEANPGIYSRIYSDSQTALLWVKNKKMKTTLKDCPETRPLLLEIQEALVWVKTHQISVPLEKWETEVWGEIPADFGRK